MLFSGIRDKLCDKVFQVICLPTFLSLTDLLLCTGDVVRSSEWNKQEGHDFQFALMCLRDNIRIGLNYLMKE